MNSAFVEITLKVIWEKFLVREEKKRIRHAFHRYKTCTKLIDGYNKDGVADLENKK